MDNKSRIMKNNRGFTLIELLIIVAIVSILAVALGFQFSGWIGSYNVESQTKNMYIDLMNARARAMGRNRAHFLTLPSATDAATYSIFEDNTPAPDGDGSVTNETTPLPTYPKTVQYPINWTGATITFDAKGIISPPDNIWVTTTVSADYDCIKLEATRLKMGKCSGTNCASCDVK